MYFYKGNPLYHHGNGAGAINHSRLRMGLSALNAHRKRYNFIHNNDCPQCGQKPEDELHYFFKCPNYANPRLELMGTITAISHRVNVFAFNLPPVTRADYNGLTSLVLFGDSRLNLKDNLLIFDTAQRYIVQTKRF